MSTIADTSCLRSSWALGLEVAAKTLQEAPAHSILSSNEVTIRSRSSSNGNCNSNGKNHRSPLILVAVGNVAYTPDLEIA